MDWQFFYSSWQDADKKPHVLVSQALNKVDVSIAFCVTSWTEFFHCWIPRGHPHGKETVSHILEDVLILYSIFIYHTCHGMQEFVTEGSHHCSSPKLDWHKRWPKVLLEAAFPFVTALACAQGTGSFPTGHQCRNCSSAEHSNTPWVDVYCRRESFASKGTDLAGSAEVSGFKLNPQ